MAQGQLNAGHLGGRFLERTFPQKVKPVPSCETEADTLPGQPKQAPETNSRVRKSAAVIGLALSVGAHGLLLSRPGDKAVAAEPVTSESATTTAPSTLDVAALSPSTEPAGTSAPAATTEVSTIDHVVQEGQTLWKLAQLYKIDVVTLANTNGISTNAVLYVGQVLKVPADSYVAAQPVQADTTPEAAPSYYGMVKAPTPAAEAPQSVAPAIAADAEMKTRQDAALAKLQQKRGSLQQALSGVKSEKAPVQQAAVDHTVLERAVLEQPATIGRTPAIEQPSLIEQPAKTERPAITLPAMAPVAIKPTPASIQTPNLEAESNVSHRVASGETLSAIARSYGVSQRQLVEANRITNPNIIRVNQTLVIPQQKSSQVAKSPLGGVNPSLALVASNTPELPVVPVEDAGSLSKAVSKPTLVVPAKPIDRKQPVAIGGPSTAEEITVATAPFLRGEPGRSESVQVEDSVSRQRYDYVESLRQEIVSLRERYRSAGVTTVPTQPVSRLSAATMTPTLAAPSSRTESSRVNPELAAARSGRGRLPERLNARSQSSNDATRSAQSKPQLLAAAPLGSQNYEPLLPSSLGQMVAPDLPPLGSVDAYLPGSTGRFNGYIWPTKGVLTSGYGWRWGRMHRGIDIAAPIGTPIVAAAPGVVITAGWNSGGYGNLVEIKHADGSVTLYAHNERVLVREGQQVEQGQQIAEMGSTGYSTGPHCHFEVHLPGQGAVNPVAYLAGRGGA